MRRLIVCANCCHIQLQITARILWVLICCKWNESAQANLEQKFLSLTNSRYCGNKGHSGVNFCDSVILHRLENPVIGEDSQLYH